MPLAVVREAPVFLPVSGSRRSHAGIGCYGAQARPITLQLDLVQAIERGTEAVIFIDPKADLSVLHRAYDAAVRAGRQKDFQFFSLAYPHLSCTLTTRCTTSCWGWKFLIVFQACSLAWPIGAVQGVRLGGHQRL